MHSTAVLYSPFKYIPGVYLMQRYTKEKALQIIIESARKYKENLLNQQLLFICSDKHNIISSLEVSFDASNFLHLTGVKTNTVVIFYINLFYPQIYHNTILNITNEIHKIAQNKV